MNKLFVLLLMSMFLISFSSALLTNGTVSYFNFDDLVNPTVTDSVDEQNGTNIGATRGITGLINNSFSFDGANDYVDANTFFPTGINEFTFSFWINTTSSSQGTLYYNPSSGSATIETRMEADGTIFTFYRDDSGNDLLFQSVTTVNDGGWHNIIVTRDTATTGKLYIDNILSASDSQAGMGTMTLSTGNSLHIGGRTSSSVNYAGLIDEFGFWSRSLSDSERSTLYNNGDGSTYPFLEEAIKVELNYPLDSVTVSSNVTFNATITPSLGFNLTNATLFIWDSDDNLFFNDTNLLTGNSSNVTSFLVDTLESGTYTWNIFGQSSNGTDIDSNFSTSNRTFTWIPFSEDSTTFNENSSETARESFDLQITTEPEILSVDANLIYNGTSYTSTVSCISGVCDISNSIDIPLVLSGESENKEFFWEVTVFDGTISFSANTTSQQQNVSRIHLEQCNATFTVETLEFLAFDESDLSSIDPFSFNGNFDIWLGSGGVSRETNFSNSLISSMNLCIYPSTEQYYINATIEYDEATGSNYTTRNYYFNNDIINSTSQGIGLGLLLSELSTSFILAVQDTDILPVADVLIFIERFYPGLNEFQTVQVSKTDDNGQSVGFFETETVDYRFILKQNGVTVLTTGIQKIVGTSVPFTLTFTIGEDAGSAWEDFEDLDDLSYSNDFDKQTEIYTFTYADTSGDFTSSLLEVYKINASGDDTLICSSTSTESSASISCNISGNTTGQYIAKGIIFRDGVRNLIFQEQFNINNFSEEAGDLGLFLGWFIILICSFAFRYNEIAGLFMINAAVIFINAFGLISFGPVFIGAMIAISIIIGVILER